MEWVLAVPPQRAHSAYQLLLQVNCVPRKWHFAGRYGSRLHPILLPGSAAAAAAAALVDVGVDGADDGLHEDPIDRTNDNAVDAVQDDEKHALCRIAIPISGSPSQVLQKAGAAGAAQALTDADENKNHGALSSMPSLPASSSLSSSLHELLQESEFVYRPVYVPKRASRDPPEIDARVHPERERYHHHHNYPIRRSCPSPPMATTGTTPTAAPTFTYAELFAGIGGFGVALKALGGKCIFLSEIDERCRTVLAANHHQKEEEDDGIATTILHGDICQVSNEQLATTMGGRVDLVVGGFPCQPFSAMGDQPGLTCPTGQLFREIVRVLHQTQPRAFLLENVPGLLHLRDGSNSNTLLLQEMVKEFEGAGYAVTYEVIDARCLTATRRKRLYIVGLSLSRGSISSSDPNNDVTPFEFPYIPDLKLRAGDVIDYDNDDHHDTVHERLYVSDEQLCRLEKNRFWDPSQLAWPNLPVDTLVSHYGRSVVRGGMFSWCRAKTRVGTHARSLGPNAPGSWDSRATLPCPTTTATNP
jgi:DNA-cytosine methyltransferase